MAIIGAIPTHIHKQGVHAQEVTNLFQSSRDIVFHSLRVHPEGLASHRPCHTGGSDWDWTSNHAHILGMHYEILTSISNHDLFRRKIPMCWGPPFFWWDWRPMDMFAIWSIWGFLDFEYSSLINYHLQIYKSRNHPNSNVLSFEVQRFNPVPSPPNSRCQWRWAHHSPAVSGSGRYWAISPVPK